jgi:transposase
VLCNAHARRKFEPIAKASKKAVLAHHAMQVYRKLYAIERKAKDEKLNYEQIKQLRQKHVAPILNEFKAWLESKINLVPKQSPIFKAMRYTLKHWDGLTRYLDDGRLSIDNNHTEREIKPFVIARKNFMFSKSQAGARAMAIHFSLIRTATLHGLDPYRYYVHIMEQIPHCKTFEDYEKLLPWNVDLSKVITSS